MAGLSGDEYANLRGRLSDLLDSVEQRRTSAKAAAVTYPSKAATVLGEADAYNEVAEDLQELLATLPK